eukprot:CAMPEP_0171401232 /NCGR_PEP_ID=MMETSP0880-20121228/7775_1 /TAXON_ID=67004 /ORGANISM="Thalassiosira weissflogii, Strain CCMP1336" /LENGTH=407 /DNA_ID=CAMNT_0011915693 /DNA_START=4 /DNA_END=1227 /DNA_ORIENTATION=-
MSASLGPQNQVVVPVAVPLSSSATAQHFNTPHAAARPSLSTADGKSMYNLPSSRRGFARVPEETVQQLMQQGFTRGLATSLAQTIKTFPLRIWVVDNSGSMQNTDGHRFVETKRSNDVKVVSCSRWNEIRECIAYHVQLAAVLEAPTTFRMLNDPAVGPNSQQFGIAETTLEKSVVQGEMKRAMEIMKMAQPGGVTPLVRHLEEILQSVLELAPQLQADGSKVVVILATDGLPTDDRGYGGPVIQNQFLQALRGLEGLPVWVVIRLCTDEQEVVDFYNDLDGQLELSLEVLDDFLEEANEVYGYNPWLNYALPLHRLREMGYQHRVFDMLDERALTHEELRDFCSLLFCADELPDPSGDWKSFAKNIDDLLKKEKDQWNPIKKKMKPWIDVSKMNKIYGDGSSCAIM